MTDNIIRNADADGIKFGDVACPTCGQLVEKWDFTPGYVLTADYVPGTLVPIPGTERRVRAEGAQGPEWTLLPCGDQFYRLRFVARDFMITEIIDELQVPT